MKNKLEPTINIKVWEKSRDRVKVAAAKQKKTMMEVWDELTLKLK